MKKVSHLNLTQYLLITVLIVAASVTTFYGYKASNYFVHFNNIWLAHTQNTQAKEEALTQIRQSMGYGGFIHHFKNYVLRQDETYLHQLRLSLDKLTIAISRFEALPNMPEEKAAIKQLKIVINSYSSKIPLAIRAQQENWPSKATDKLVKVDDKPAFTALKRLENLWFQQYQQDNQAFEESLYASQKVRDYAFIAFIILIGFILTTIWFIHRLVTETTTRKELEHQLYLSQVAIEHSTNAVSIADDGGKIIFTNPAFSTITGFSSGEVLGQDHHVLSSGRHKEEFYQNLWRSIHEEGQWEGEIWDRHKSGRVYPEWLSIVKLPAEIKTPGRYVAVFSDISERKALEKETIYQATHDPLTKLPNRRLFYDRLNTAILESKRSKTNLAVLFLDLDRFKPINDTHGHAVGDQILAEVAQRITSNLRETDSVCRYGGDEFVILLTNLKDDIQWHHIGQQLEAAISKPYFVDDMSLSIGVSIGEALHHHYDERVSPDDLIGQADKAMYQIKTQKHAALLKNP